MLFAYQFARVFFLKCGWFFMTSILLDNFQVAVIWWSSIAGPGGLPLDVVVAKRSDKMFLYALIYLLPIAN